MDTQRLWLIFYVFYRFVSIVCGIAVISQEIYDISSTGFSMPRLLLRLVLGLYWSLMLWSCPYLLSVDWEKDLPQRVWARKPSRLWIFFFVFGFPVLLLGNFVMMAFAITLAFQDWISSALVLAAASSLLLSPPLVNGYVRVFIHQRSGKFAQFSSQSKS